MLTCREVSRLVSDAMECDLPLWTRVRLRAHMLLCPACRRYERQVHLLRKTAREIHRQALDGEQSNVCLSDDARGRILQTLQDA